MPSKKLSLIFFLFSSLLLCQKANSQEVQILFPHLYFGDEVELSLQKRDWIGLYEGENQFTLEPAQVTITLTQHHMTDADGEKTGKRVSAVPKRPFMLISDLEELSLGPVNHVELKKTNLSPGDTVHIDLFEKRYQLIASGGIGEQGGVQGYQVILQSGDKRQLIGESDFLDDAEFRVIWAGDLDGDQELDLLMDLSHKYSFGLFSLFMSSKKQTGQLLYLTAQHLMYYD
ncbi:MAG: hypothetical protein HEP71_10550 [Roseivirga sp.]|nr:hypothetical protein [Roseivirga sp.]